MSSSPLDPIVEAYLEGHAAQLVTGRSPLDLLADEGRLRTVLETLRRRLRREHGLHLVTYSLAMGLDWDDARVADERDRRTLRQSLAAHGLPADGDTSDPERVVRGLSSLLRSPAGTLSWASGQPLRFAAALLHAEHLAPGSMSHGSQSTEQLVFIELAHVLASSLALRSSGNMALLFGREALIHELLRGVLHEVRLPQPTRAEKAGFVEAAQQVYPDATLEGGLDVATVAHLAANTPNRGLDALLCASHRRHWPVTSQALVEQKMRDVPLVSEGTLTVLETDSVADADLRGRNIAAARQVMERFAAGLRAGDDAVPGAVLLAGPPGSGKTDLARIAARAAGVAAYEMHVPKRPYVGQTEMLARAQQDLLRQWEPNLSFIDEITESFPTARTEFDGDAGASRAVLGELMKALSDERRRGRSMLVATTNVPSRISAAMLSRFVVIPVLHPVEEDFPEIVAATMRRVEPTVDASPFAPAIIEAAAVLYAQGATPRHVRDVVSRARLWRGAVTPDTVLESARDACAVAARQALALCDLWALRHCRARSFLPWAAEPASYPYPPHLEGVVDHRTGDILLNELMRRIRDLEPHANV